METAIKFLDMFLLATNVVSQLTQSCWGMSASQDSSTVITLNALGSELGMQVTTAQSPPAALALGTLEWDTLPAKYSVPFSSKWWLFFFLKWVESDK